MIVKYVQDQYLNKFNPDACIVLAKHAYLYTVLQSITS